MPNNNLEDNQNNSHEIQIITANLQGATHGARYDFGLKNIINQKPDIILAQELWSMVPNPDLLQHLSNLDYDTNIFIPDSYDQNVRGTGTGMLTATRMTTTKSIDCKKYNERISILSLEQPKMDVINIYAPTSSKTKSEKEHFFENLIDLIMNLAKSEDNILVGGDFNIDPSKNPLSKIKNLELIKSDQPTHQSGSNLDYFYATKSLEIKFCKIVVNGSSDHDALLLNMSIPVFELNAEIYAEIIEEKYTIPKNQTQIEKFKINIQKYIQGNMSADEKNFLEVTTHIKKTVRPAASNEKMLANILKIMEEGIKSASKKQEKVKSKIKHSSSWSQTCTTIHDEMKLLKNLPKSEEILRIYNLKKKELKAEIRKLRVKENEKLENELLEKYENDINGFYKKIKMLTKSTQKKPPILEIYKKYETIFGCRSDFTPIKFKSEDYYPINSNDTFQMLEQVKKGKSSYKNITIELWKLVDINLITNFFNAIFIYGVMPQDLLACTVKPLIKNGLESAKSADNWRPISLVHALSKGLEIIMAKRINFETSANQYGFKKGASTLHCYKDTITFIKSIREEEGIAWCVFLDMKKAFDSIPFSQLVKIVKEKSETNFIARAFQNFITKSTVYLGENTETGEKLKINPKCGVKQGALNSPPLFTNVLDKFLRENDYSPFKNEEFAVEIVENIDRKKKGYADDLGIVTRKAIQLDYSIREFEKFCVETGLTPNSSKTKIMVFVGPQMSDKIKNLPNFYLCGNKLEYVNQYKYLGFQVHNSLNEKYHMEYILSKFRKKVMANRKIIKSPSIKIRLKLLKTYELPKLYGLETIPESIIEKYIERFNYITSISLKRDLVQTKAIQNENPEITLPVIAQKARDRYAKL